MSELPEKMVWTKGPEKLKRIIELTREFQNNRYKRLRDDPLIAPRIIFGIAVAGLVFVADEPNDVLVPGLLVRIVGEQDLRRVFSRR